MAKKSLAKKSLKDALTLQPKRAPVRKSRIDIQETEQAVKKIHKEPASPLQKAPEEKKAPEVKTKQRSKRVTVDIPLPLHTAIKMKTFQEGITIKDYLLTLAEKDLGI